MGGSADLSEKKQQYSYKASSPNKKEQHSAIWCVTYAVKHLLMSLLAEF